eukprot:TRINITY_DN13854_c0_g1_i2.p1 TRINITY_DN13854_c0_g1~~TRINITY_DN13854_c0_g1_i2.p1  ORF type:complete len:112 (-),score=8.87 TRINITY_DN13854_c0_g1_i2:186-521(-)
MDERLPIVLEALGLAKNFDFVLTSYDHGREKPCSTIFSKARKLAGLDDDALALHCGDSFERDVVGAHQAGYKAMFISEEIPANEASLRHCTGGLEYHVAPDIGHILQLLHP